MKTTHVLSQVMVVCLVPLLASGIAAAYEPVAQVGLYGETVTVERTRRVGNRMLVVGTVTGEYVASSKHDRTFARPVFRKGKGATVMSRFVDVQPHRYYTGSHFHEGRPSSMNSSGLVADNYVLPTAFGGIKFIALLPIGQQIALDLAPGRNKTKVPVRITALPTGAVDLMPPPGVTAHPIPPTRPRSRGNNGLFSGK